MAALLPWRWLQHRPDDRGRRAHGLSNRCAYSHRPGSAEIFRSRILSQSKLQKALRDELISELSCLPRLPKDSSFGPFVQSCEQVEDRGLKLKDRRLVSALRDGNCYPSSSF